MMLNQIHERMEACLRQRRLDMALSLFSFLAINIIVYYCYGPRLILMSPFIVCAVIVHAIVMMYCYRLWSFRLRRWKALERGVELMEHVQGLFTETSELRSSLLRSADIAEGILRSRPT